MLFTGSRSSIRLIAIAQLCLAFTVLMSYILQPFTDELLTYKSKLLLYHSVMGLGEKDENQPKLARNHERYLLLPETERIQIIQGYHALQESVLPFLAKTKQALLGLTLEMPPLKQAWLLLSILVPILLLLKRQGAEQLAWLLPIVASLYAYDNYMHASPIPSSADQQLFPAEQVIINDYLKEPLSKEISEQQKQLKLGWERYLIHIWANESPDKDPIIFQLQIEKGEFAFQIARLKALAENANHIDVPYQEPLFLLVLYVLWNSLFLWVLHRSMPILNSNEK